MDIYGVCVSDIDTINNEKVMQLLIELAELGFDSYFSEFTENKGEFGDEYSVSDYLYNYESESYYGLSAFLHDIISEVEGIDIECDDPNGVRYLGLGADAPWAFNEKTRNMSAEEYRNILTKYINKVTDETLEIRWWSVHDDCDL